MSKLSDAIKRSRAKRGAFAGDPQAIVAQSAEIVAVAAMEAMKPELIAAAEEAGEQAITDKLKKKFKGDPGQPGPQGRAIKGDKGDKPTKAELEEIIIPLIPAPEKLTEKKLRKVLKPMIPKPLPGKPGEKGDDGSPDTPEDIVKKLKKVGLSMSIIIGLEDALKAMRQNIRSKGGKGGKRGGGGMTIDAGSNITLVRNSNGRWTISSTASGSTNIATEQVTAVQSGDHVTIALAQLAHVASSVLLVSRNGQVLMPNGSAGLPGSSWSQAGSTITVYNADAGDIFLVQYLYA